MKKIFTLIACALVCNVALAEDLKTVDFEGDYFSALIDNPQYYGKQLYGDGTYNWKDATTTLSSKLTNAWGDGMFWGGGIAISNYVNDTISVGGSATQLTVPVSNGSTNFAIVYCTGSMTFADGTARELVSMDIMNTNYFLNLAKNGDAYTKALVNSGDYATLIITADNNQTVKVDLARDGKFIESWTKVDLSSLGKVKTLTFTMEGSDTSYGYLNTPQYVAIDNIIVDMTEDATSVQTIAASTSSKNYFSLDGKRLNAPQKGINIIRYADGTTKKVNIK